MYFCTVDSAGQQFLYQAINCACKIALNQIVDDRPRYVTSQAQLNASCLALVIPNKVSVLILHFTSLILWPLVNRSIA